MDWLARKLFPRARPFERRSRMQMLYLAAVMVVIASGGLAAILWLLNQPFRP